MTHAAVLDRYVDHLLVTESRTPPRRFAPPVGRETRPLSDIAALLADPRGTWGPHDDPLRSLVVVALWLGEQPENRLGDLGSRAARFRFLVWSLFPRLVAAGLPEPELGRVAWPGDQDTTISAEFIRAQARVARRDWMSYMDEWEDDPWLSARQAAGAGLVEYDLRWISTTWPRSRRRNRGAWPAGPCWLDLGSPAARPDVRYGDHRRVAADLAERHWLPGLSILGAAAAFFPHRPTRQAAVLVYPALAILVLAAFTSGFDQARWLAAALCGTGLVAVVLLPSRLDALALLRTPATAAIGAAVLLSLTPRWWIDLRGWVVGVALLVGSVAYLAVDARFHGVPRWRAFGRAAGVAGVGALHAAMVCLVVLGFVAPTVAENGQCLAGWWTAHPWTIRPLGTDCGEVLNTASAAAPAGVLVLMAGWAFALGLVAQVLWEDRGVTAPLGRARRRRGAS